MSDTIKLARQVHVSFTPQALREWRAIPEQVRVSLEAYIRENAGRSHEQMMVTGWTWELPAHIYRAYKVYKVKPSWRIIYHHEGDWSTIVIDRIAARCNDPYGDGK